MELPRLIIERCICTGEKRAPYELDEGLQRGYRSRIRPNTYYLTLPPNPEDLADGVSGPNTIW
jgi:hypothetical protein